MRILMYFGASLSDNDNRERFIGVLSASGKALLPIENFCRHSNAPMCTKILLDVYEAVQHTKNVR